jgi:hypothetical protein
MTQDVAPIQGSEAGVLLPPSKLPPLVPPPELSDQWVTESVDAVESSITKLVDDFLVNPFTHRVEHSLHVQLYQLLSEWDRFKGMYSIGKTRFKTQLIHKEWPETKPRKNEDGTDRRRGSFDLAILAPSQLEEVTEIKQFIYGTIAAPIVIELGLGYTDKHLGDDEIKVLGSDVQHPYLVHFSRLRTARQKDIETRISDIGPRVKVAYVHYDFGPNFETDTVTYKQLNGPMRKRTDRLAGGTTSTTGT